MVISTDILSVRRTSITSASHLIAVYRILNVERFRDPRPACQLPFSRLRIPRRSGRGGGVVAKPIQCDVQWAMPNSG